MAEKCCSPRMPSLEMQVPRGWLDGVGWCGRSGDAPRVLVYGAVLDSGICVLVLVFQDFFPYVIVDMCIE